MAAAISSSSNMQTAFTKEFLAIIKKTDPLSNKELEGSSKKTLLKLMLAWGLKTLGLRLKNPDSPVKMSWIVELHQKAWNALVQKTAQEQIRLFKEHYFRNSPSLLHNLLQEQRLHQFKTRHEIPSIAPMNSIQTAIDLLKQWNENPSLLHPYLYEAD